MANRLVSFLSSFMLLLGFSIAANAAEIAIDDGHHTHPNVVLIECVFNKKYQGYLVSSVTPNRFNQVKEGDDCALALSEVAMTGYKMQFTENTTDHEENIDYLVYTLIRK